MEKKFSKFDLAKFKRIAQNVNQYITKKNKLMAEIEKKQKEVDELQSMIELSDAPVKFMTGGYGIEDIIKKVVTPTDKVNKDGSVYKQVSYEFIYPDTIIPPVTENTEESTIETESSNI